jgi:hypothetical protein
VKINKPCFSGAKELRLIVHMSPPETAIALMLAVMRNTTARQNSVTDKQMGKQDPIEIDRDGILAEMAFGKQFNLYPDLSVYPRKGGADLITHNNLKVDVKATRYKNGRLLIHVDKSVQEVHIYALAVVDGDTVDLIGYIKSIDAMQEKNLKDLGHGVGYAIDQSSLTPFKE